MSIITQSNFCNFQSGSNVSQDLGEQKVVRKFINSAVYVEKILPELTPTSNVDYSNRRSTSKTRKTLKCCCSTSFKKCPCHSTDFVEDNCNYTYRTDSSSESDKKSQITVKQNIQDNADELRLSLTSVNSQRNYYLDNTEREKIIKNWLAKKEQEKRKKELIEQKIKEQKQKEREQRLEKERENFRNWLADKKREEMLKKKEKERLEEEEKLKEEEKEKRQLENELTYELWLQKKRKDGLVKKIKEKVKDMELAEEKQKRVEENKIAFDEWLKNSKNKPRPLPLNQGLLSLCSSLSVTYINPEPWNNDT